jgi:hypothetical protein
MGGVGMLRVGDSCRFGKPDDWPSAWQVRWFSVWQSAGALDERRRSGLDGRRADIEWVDQTLGGAAADIRRHFAVDVIIDPDLYAKQDLLTVSRRGITWSELSAEIAGQLNASCVFADGAAVLGRREWVAVLSGASIVQESPAAAPTSATAGESASSAWAPQSGWWHRWVRLEVKDESWKTALRPMMELMGPAADWHADHAPGLDARAWTAEAEGGVGQVLEGLSLLGYLQWRPLAGASSGGAVRIEMQ